MTLSLANIQSQLSSLSDPILGRGGFLPYIKNLAVTGSHIEMVLKLPFPAATCEAAWREAIQAHLKAWQDDITIALTFTYDIQSYGIQPGLKAIPGIRNIIAIGSGKGGVGKSTVAVNVALALKAEGARVGLLDADIYGPSQPMMLGAGEERPEALENKQMQPIICHGMPMMSMGLLVDVEAPMIWRGPMVSGALQQLLNGTVWPELDYLIVDLPPGTGDIQLTLAQKIPVSGAVVVTTPQDIALLDARRAYGMFRKVSIPVLGVVENMSLHTCSACGHSEAIFGEGGAAEFAAQNETVLLGQLPLAKSIREQSDAGHPIVIAAPDSPIATQFHHIAQQIVLQLSRQKRHMAGKFPNIVVERSEHK